MNYRFTEQYRYSDEKHRINPVSWEWKW